MRGSAHSEFVRDVRHGVAAWPREAPRREEEPTLYRLDSDRAAADSASVASGGGGGAGAVMAASSGGAIVRLGERTMGTFPESKPYPPSF